MVNYFVIGCSSNPINASLEARTSQVSVFFYYHFIERKIRDNSHCKYHKVWTKQKLQVTVSFEKVEEFEFILLYVTLH